MPPRKPTGFSRGFVTLLRRRLRGQTREAASPRLLNIRASHLKEWLLAQSASLALAVSLSPTQSPIDVSLLALSLDVPNLSSEALCRYAPDRGGDHFVQGLGFAKAVKVGETDSHSPLSSAIPRFDCYDVARRFIRFALLPTEDTITIACSALTAHSPLGLANHHYQMTLVSLAKIGIGLEPKERGIP